MTEVIYTRQGDYELPNLTLPEQPETGVGRYAGMRRKYLKENHRVLYFNLLTSCRLMQHLEAVEAETMRMEEMIIKRMAAAEGVTEALKSSDPMSWVRRMNNIRNAAQEIAKAAVIFA